jgi:arylsulfatase
MASDLSPGGVTRREFIRRTCQVASGAVLAESLNPTTAARAGASSQNATAGRPPNILLLIVDQLRYPLWEGAATPLPGINRLREEGMTFAAMYCSATPCTPSRASLFTGLHMAQHGLEINVCEQVPALNPTIPTLGHYFEHAGYRTPYFGKWHLSTETEYDEDVGLKPYGFEEWCCRQPEAEPWCCAPGAEASTPCCADSQGVPGQGATDDPLIAERAIKWLAAKGKERTPWLLVCSLVNPHDIMFYKRFAPTENNEPLPSVTTALPPNFDDDLSTKPSAQAQYQKLWGLLWEMPASGPTAASTEDWLKAMDYYYYVTNKADTQIQNVLRALDDPELYENTVVVFMSDHGEMAGAHKLMGKGPFAYEESVRVPLIVRWPGKVPANTTTNSLAQTVDLLPTLLDLAGIVPANNYLPGKSLMPVLLGAPGAKVNDHVLMAYGMSIAALVAEYADYGAVLPVDYVRVPWKFHALYDGAYKYVRYFETDQLGEEYELYAYAQNRFELDNLARKPAMQTVRAAMAARLQTAEQTEMASVNPAYFNAPFGPVLAAEAAGPGQVRLRFDTQKDVRYQVQATSNFQDWTDRGTALIGTGEAMEVLLAADLSATFFRVRRLG